MKFRSQLIVGILILAGITPTVMHYVRKSSMKRTELEASLFEFILYEEMKNAIERLPLEFEHEGITYNKRPEFIDVGIAMGVKDFGEWIDPEDDVLNAIGAKWIKPASQVDESTPVCLFERPNWISRNSAEINYSIHYSTFAGGEIYQKLEFKEGRWKQLERKIKAIH